jgi:dTMP kinase
LKTTTTTTTTNVDDKNMKYIAVVGLDGSGKSTAITTIQEALVKTGAKVVNTSEPGGTPLAEELGSLAKKIFTETVDSNTELLIMSAGRNQLINNVIKPALKRGDFVLSDRCHLCSDAYQGSGSDTLLHEALEATIIGDCKPDHVFLLDLHPSVCFERIKARGESMDRIESKGLDYFQQVRNNYLSLAENYNNITIIDANKSIQEVSDSITQAMNTLLLTAS